MTEQVSEATHVVHWRASCDAQIIGPHWGFVRTHEARIRQASGMLDGGLIADRCKFGPRRLTLEGEVEYIPPKWHKAAPSAFGRDLAESVLRWTLTTLYGVQSMEHQGAGEPANLHVAIKVRPLNPEETA